MPALTHPAVPGEVLLPPRHAQLAGECDVLVVGGGPAGIGAALGAAAVGADVVLVERYGFLGGNATVCLVSPWMSFHTRRPKPPRLGDTSLLPSDHGEGEPVVGGKHVEVIERLIAAGGAIAPSLATGYTVPFDPEVFKTVALDLLDQAQVRYLLHAFASGVHDDAVILETKSGPLLLRAAMVVDCTGDGDVAAAAGAEYEIGRESDGLTQPMTLMARIQVRRTPRTPPGRSLAESYVVQSGIGIGVRETRRIVGDYVLTADDVLTARKFDDVIARGTYPIDIHNPTGRGTVLKAVPPGAAYDIPLRCLLPRGVDHVLTAGRCISGTHEAHSSYRVTPTAMATGQAAGVCARSRRV